jgi:hypothetical protein
MWLSYNSVSQPPVRGLAPACKRIKGTNSFITKGIFFLETVGKRLL